MVKWTQILRGILVSFWLTNNLIHTRIMYDQVWLKLKSPEWLSKCYNLSISRLFIRIYFYFH
jgi:hypothetical protein